MSDAAVIYWRVHVAALALIGAANTSGVVKDLLYGEWGSALFGVVGLALCTLTYRFGAHPRLQEAQRSAHDREVAARQARIVELEKELGIR